MDPKPWLSKFKPWFDDIYEIIETLWLSAFSVIGIVTLDFVLFVIPQGDELLRQLKDTQSLCRWVIFGFACVYASVAFLVAAQGTVWKKRNRRDGEERPEFLLPWIVFIGAAGSCLNLISPGVAPLANGVFLIGSLIFAPTIATRCPRVVSKLVRAAQAISGPWTWAVLLLLGVAVFVGLYYSRVDFARTIGTLGIVYLAFGFWTLIATLCFVLFVRSIGLPALPLLPVLLFVWFSYYNENHRVRVLKSGGSSVALKAFYDRWIDERCPVKTGVRPCPIILVSAQGGGIRAAYWTARVLTELDRVSSGRFTDHVFAISGVSGGAIGAAAYVAARRNGIDREPATLRVKRFLSEDYLSPVVGGLMFSDFAQRFLPFPIESFDRSIAFENALETSWSRAFAGADSMVFCRDVNELYFGRGHGARVLRPALMINATNVETGHRFVVSNITLPRGSTDAYFAYDAPVRVSGLRLSTAVHLAARFLYVSPQGVLWTPVSNPRQRLSSTDENGELPWGRLVDGGYFDDSGIATLIDLIHALEAVSSTDRKRQRLRYVVVVISNGEGRVDPVKLNGELSNPPPRPVAPANSVRSSYNGSSESELEKRFPGIGRRSEPLSELSSPPRALLQAGWAHGDSEGDSVWRAAAQLNAESRGCDNEKDCTDIVEISFASFLYAYRDRVRFSGEGRSSIDCLNGDGGGPTLCQGALSATYPGLGWSLSSGSLKALDDLALCSSKGGMKHTSLVYVPPFGAIDRYYGSRLLTKEKCDPR